MTNAKTKKIKTEATVASGYQGAATASGYLGAARGKDGCALFLVYRDYEGTIKHAWGGVVGRSGINADTYYRLNEAGEPIEVEL